MILQCFLHLIVYPVFLYTSTAKSNHDTFVGRNFFRQSGNHPAPHYQFDGILKDKIFHILSIVIISVIIHFSCFMQIYTNYLKPCRNQAMNCCVREGTIADNQGFISSATNNQ